MADETPLVVKRGPFAPLRVPVFRRIWFASLFANFGALIQGVGAAWAMTTMTDRAELIALVQSATFAPMMLGAIPAGAIADTYDRRKVALTAQCICFAGASGLALITFMGWLTPALLLLFCFIVGSGAALLAPAWQASVREQVPPRDLPAAIGLNSISYNIARSFGPAIGGLLVAVAGVLSAFAFNAVAYLPAMLTMYMWRRTPEKSRLPPEGLTRAIVSGIRYVFHSPAIRTVWLRTFILGLSGSSVSALMPLIARDMLGGGASTYGILLGFFGVGAVAGALYMSRLRLRLSVHDITTYLAVGMGVAVILLGLSHSFILSCLILFLAGACWMIAVAQANIVVQVAAPGWVGGRALAAYQVAIAGGISIGGWAWGHVAADLGIRAAVIASGIMLMANVLPALWLRIHDAEREEPGTEPTLPDIKVGLNLVGRSGPIIISMEYRVPTDKAREFYKVMQAVQLVRQRSGAYGWSISRDIADPELWTERYHTPTWHDYLRQRNRLTPADRDISSHAQTFHIGDEPPVISRKLERPFGSVRWAEDTPDMTGEIVIPVSPPSNLS